MVKISGGNSSFNCLNAQLPLLKITLEKEMKTLIFVAWDRIFLITLSLIVFSRKICTLLSKNM